MMASFKYYNSIILFTMIVLYIFLFSVCYTAQIKYRTHHTLNLKQHGQLSQCINWSSTTNPAQGKDSATAVFEVFHGHRLCADGTTSSSSSAGKILRRDQQRVKHIRHKIMNTTNIHSSIDEYHSVVPVQSGYNLDHGGGYIVRIGLGTPTRKLHLILDTASDLTWTQCLPCLWNCYKQRDRTFNPAKSTSYSNISCTDRECLQSDVRCYRNRTCAYISSYNDNSYTFGFMAKEKLTMTKNDVFPNFMFGCSQKYGGNFGQTAGILGLSPGRLSIVSQTMQIYRGYFSHFLPSNLSSTGHLTFGRNINNTRDVKFTSLIYDPQYSYSYFINITSITVGGKRLPIHPLVFKNNKNIIDSSTKTTSLPQKAYIAMRNEFKHQMNTKRYLIAPAVEDLDTCFYVPKDKNIEFPTIMLTFKGDVTIEVGRFGIFFVVNSSVVCLAFKGNGGEKDAFSILGNMVQQDMEVVYDVVGGKLGFRVPTS